ncbi:MAG: hypothetical protein ACRCV4_08730 [Hafnia alvei]
MKSESFYLCQFSNLDELREEVEKDVYYYNKVLA